MSLMEKVTFFTSYLSINKTSQRQKKQKQQQQPYNQLEWLKVKYDVTSITKFSKVLVEMMIKTYLQMEHFQLEPFPFISFCSSSSSSWLFIYIFMVLNL